MQRTIYECNQCKKEIGRTAHFTLNFCGNGSTSGVAVPPESTKGGRWHVQGFEQTWIHLHFGCVASYFKALQPKPKRA